MLFVDNQGHTDPRLNLALEEYLLRSLAVDEPILLFYINEPAVIIGRNQNTLEEIDPAYVAAEGIHVVRRLSGGGAVYHDRGNLNFSFVTPGREDLHNFAKFTGPVIQVLRSLGVPAELAGRSDIFATGKKISGNAQYVAGERMFSHGTLLFDTNLTHMLRALNPRQTAIESKAVQSIRNFVANIRELLDEDMSIQAFRTHLLQGLFAPGSVVQYPLSEADWQAVRRLRQERYDNWDWNYGHSPPFNLRQGGRYPAGKIEARLRVEGGRIQALQFVGDFAGRRPASELAGRLIGVRHQRPALAAALAEVDVSDYLGPFTVDELLHLLL